MKSKTIIEKANNFLNEANNRILVFEFLEKFSQCEVYARLVLKSYLKSYEPSIKEEEIGLECKQIISAFSENGIYFEDIKIIYNIFGRNHKLNESSCRWLRNKITHSLMQRALKEVCIRFNELMDYMNSFIQEIEKQI